MNERPLTYREERARRLSVAAWSRPVVMIMIGLLLEGFAILLVRGAYAAFLVLAVGFSLPMFAWLARDLRLPRKLTVDPPNLAGGIAVAIALTSGVLALEGELDARAFGGVVLAVLLWAAGLYLVTNYFWGMRHRTY